MIKKYFARANGARGETNLLMSNLLGIDNLFILEGISAFQKTHIMKRLISHFENTYKNIECIVSPFNISHYDAVIIRDIKFAMVSSSILPLNTLGKKESLDGVAFLKNSGLDEPYIALLKERATAEYERFYKEFSEAKKIHDDWEAMYIKNMDWDSLAAYQNGILTELVPITYAKQGTYKYERFFGASTPDGTVNYIDDLTKGLKTRFFIKGRPGTGKSTFLKRLCRELSEKGYGCEVYRCSLDSESLDMVLCPELSFCVFDSTSPHEKFPETDRDKILDFYEESGLSGFDEKYEKELSLVKQTYGFHIALGLGYLRLGNLYSSRREALLEKATDFNKLDIFSDKIIRKILG